MNVPILEDRSVSTACTDGRRIHYNPDFMGKLTTPERRFVLMHELMHILLMHPVRAGSRDPELYNVAADIVVNDICVRLAPKLGMEQIKGGIYATVRPDQSAEDIYGLLQQDNQRRKAGSGITVRGRYSYGVDRSGTSVFSPTKDLMPGKLTDEERKALENEIRRLLRAARKGDPGVGPSVFVPPALIKLVDSPRLDWKALFKQYMNETEDDDTSYATPERKYLHMDLILPGHCQTEGRLPEVWAFVDSSGSIGQDEMSHFLTQLYRISKQFRCTMHIAYWDTSVTDVYRNIVGEKTILKCLPKHSGGTDINCVYKWLRQERVKPDVMLILTDGAYGTLSPEYHSRSLRQRTILVLSHGASAANREDVGRVAAL